jgi:acylphosphatase
MKRVLIRVSGKVQGVFFRASTRDEANRLGLSGRVRNEQDGSVYIEAEGDAAVLTHFIDWCRKGPPRAQVLTFVIEEAEPAGYVGFRIDRS